MGSVTDIIGDASGVGTNALDGVVAAVCKLVSTGSTALIGTANLVGSAN